MTSIHRKFATLIGLTALVLAPTLSLAETAPARIVVVGEGVSSVIPDMAHITVGVVHRAQTAAEALSEMNADLAAILARLTSSGVDPRHIQTAGLHVTQIRGNYDSLQKTIEFEASSNLNVQVLDLPKLGEILDAVVQDGANEMRGLRFDVADRAPHVNDARKNAVADARAKAELYADAAGVELGEVLLVSEGNRGDLPSPMMLESVRSASVPIAEGELSITATVNMIWSIK